MFSRIRLSLVLLLCSCTVLEDRNDCPCHLHLDFSDPANFTTDSLCVHLNSGVYSSQMSLSSNRYNEGITVTVPGRNGVYVNVLDGDSGRYDNDGEIRIPVGEQCPRTYLFSTFCETSGPESEARVRIRKNYCGVTVSFVSGDAEKYRMTVTGNICGYSREGTPLEGLFRVNPVFDGFSVGFFRVPRQIDNSLMLSVTEASSGLTRNFALGSYIAESGYDWAKADMDDIVLNIDYAATSLSISVDRWERDSSFEVRI